MQRTLSSSWLLLRQSWDVLRADTQLLVFPILSTIATLVVLASFALPAALLMPWDRLGAETARGLTHSPWWYVGLFAFYFVNFFIVTFFNSALVACASNRFEGKDSSVGAGLRAAVARLPQILMWTVVASTVGMLLRAVQERVGLLGSIVVRLVGMAWAIATYFVVPVLVLEGLGPVEAIKRSVAILRKNWGESLALNLGLGLIGFLLVIVALLPLVIGGATSALTSTWAAAIIGGVLTALLLTLLGLITSTLKVIVQTALYRFAATGDAPRGFDRALLEQAIRRK
ncbi:MAG: DUF6159 family protein [Phycisphaerales bacterium]